MKKPLTILSVLILFGFQGCYYGSMTGARTRGKSHDCYRRGGAAGISHRRRQAGSRGEQYRRCACLSIAYLSLRGHGQDRYRSFGRAYGLGPMIRVGLLDPGKPYAVSVNAGAGYIVPAKLLGTRFGAAAGYSFGGSLEIYAGWDGGYGPDVINIPENADGGNDWDEVENTFHHAMNAGILYFLPPAGGEWMPEAAGFEFSVPLDLSRNLVMFGLAVTY